MMTGRKTSLFFFMLIFTVFFNLLFTGNSKADPLSISGANQMSTGGSQTISASGGCEPYSWMNASGGGELSGSGSSATYTAPPSNPGCQSNAEICVQDSCGQQTCMPIAINTSTAVAYHYKYQTGAGGTSCYNGNPDELGPRTPFTEELHSCDGTLIYSCSSTVCLYSDDAWIHHAFCGPWNYGNGEPLGYTDTRSPQMIDAGCCPAGLPGGGSGSGGDGTGSKGGSNGCGGSDGGAGSGSGGAPGAGSASGESNNSGSPNKPVGSSANIISGNLYHSQTVAGLTLSYNSIDTYSGSLGPKWTHGYDLKLTALSDNATLVLKRGDGNIIYFRLSGGIYYPEAISGDTSQIVKNSNGTYTRTAKNGVVQEYNASGLLTSIRDRNSNYTTLTYSGSVLASITDKNNRTTTLTYNTDGTIHSIADAMPGRPAYVLGYNTEGMLSSITDPLSNFWSFTYESGTGRMLTKKDETANQTWTYTYYPDGKLNTSKDPNDKERIIAYSPTTQTTTVTEKDTGLWTYTYDPVYSVITSQTDPLGHTTQYKHDLKRNLTKVIYHDSTTKKYTYDPANGNMLSATDALEKTTYYTYNALNLVETVTDQLNHVTRYGYDTNGNLTTITQEGEPGTADDLVTTYGYDSKGNITSIETPQHRTDHKKTIMTYDPVTNDRLTIDDPDPNNGPVVMTYYPMGTMHTSTDALQHITHYEYNNLDQLTKITDHQQHETNYTNDHNGNRLSVIDANTKPTYYEYNFNNQLTQIKKYIDNVENITTLSYSGSGCASCSTGVEKLISVKDAKNQETTFEYNKAGNLVKETDPLLKSTTYTYDVKNNLETRTSPAPDSKTITYVYYPNNRLHQKQYTSGGNTVYEYDDAGNMTYAGNASIAYNMQYDAFNRLKTITDSNGKTIQYEYNADGKRSQMITPDNRTLIYTYNDDGNLFQMATPLGNFTFTYDAANRRDTRQYPNGTTSTYSYDTINRLTGIQTTKDTTTIDDVNYTQFDAVGNRLTKTKTTPQQENWTYIYDDIYRLTNASPTGTTTPENYTYDAVGNRVTSGNAQFPQTNEAIVYSYDDENRLTGVQITQGSLVKQLTFAYDPFGRRISKTIVQDQIGTDCQSPNVCPRTTNYVYDGQSIIMEYDQNGNITAKYTHGPNIDEPLAIQQGTNTYYYHADGLGSITALSNTSGTLVQTYSYDSFGNMTATGSITQPFTYTAREYDSETAMYFYRARYYDPKVGRFVTKDPIGFKGGINVFAYVENNPINYVDPEGTVLLQIGAGIGVVVTVGVVYIVWKCTDQCSKKNKCNDLEDPDRGKNIKKCIDMCIEPWLGFLGLSGGKAAGVRMGREVGSAVGGSLSK